MTSGSSLRAVSGNSPVFETPACTALPPAAEVATASEVLAALTAEEISCPRGTETNRATRFFTGAGHCWGGTVFCGCGCDCSFGAEGLAGAPPDVIDEENSDVKEVILPWGFTGTAFFAGELFFILKSREKHNLKQGQRKLVS